MINHCGFSYSISILSLFFSKSAKIFYFVPKINRILRVAYFQIAVIQAIDNFCITVKVRGKTIESCYKNI